MASSWTSTIRDRLKQNAVLRQTAEMAQTVTAKRTYAYRMKYPPGHYYSPIPSFREVRGRASSIFAVPESLPGIDLREAEQLKLVEQFGIYQGDFRFPSSAEPGYRYYFENEFYSHGDATMLYSMLRYLEPSHVIEIGSGFSSALMLDVNDRYLEGKVQFTFIEPYTERLDGLLTTRDRQDTDILKNFVQDVDLKTFDRLESGDILFIDSTHVSKTGSDVNFLIFEVLPRLRPGVIVHVHDVFYPFEYPKEWIFEGRNWNEDYLLRAFLMHNSEFRILVFSSYLAAFHRDEVSKTLPIWSKNPGGNIWLERAQTRP